MEDFQDSASDFFTNIPFTFALIESEAISHRKYCHDKRESDKSAEAYYDTHWFPEHCFSENHWDDAKGCCSRSQEDRAHTSQTGFKGRLVYRDTVFRAKFCRIIVHDNRISNNDTDKGDNAEDSG